MDGPSRNNFQQNIRLRETEGDMVEPTTVEVKAIPIIETIMNVLQKLTARLGAIENRPRRTDKPTAKELMGQSTTVCWKGLKPRHFKRNCPNPKEKAVKWQGMQ